MKSRDYNGLESPPDPPKALLETAEDEDKSELPYTVAGAWEETESLNEYFYGMTLTYAGRRTEGMVYGPRAMKIDRTV